MTAADLASPRYLAGIDAIEAHPAGIRAHAPAKTILVWNHAHLTEACGGYGQPGTRWVTNADRTKK